MQWFVPRELLWAIIGALAITVIALFPSHYPYSQTPKVDPQQESAKGAGGGNVAQHAPTGLKESAGDENKRDGSKYASDAEIWGVKRGEWLLFLATMALWYATWRLVTGADETAKRQLRAYISATSVTAIIELGPDGGVQVTTLVVLTNSGQTPGILTGISIETKIDGGTVEPFGGEHTNPHHREIAPRTDLETRMIAGMGYGVFSRDSGGNQSRAMMNAIIKYKYIDYLGNETRRNVEFRGRLLFYLVALPKTVPLELLGSVPYNGIWEEPPHPETREYIG